jgi:uncharacterized membrane protein YagU involved in acid resistance
LERFAANRAAGRQAGNGAVEPRGANAGSTAMQMQAEAPLALRSRLVIGAIAGVVGTAAMTAAMRRLHRQLSPEEQYPLPPREITEAVIGGAREETVRDQSTLAHFGFGAAAGALVAAVRPMPSVLSGALAGVGIWTASYLGWAPALGILEPATEHPARRNALMIGVHLVWGAATASTFREVAAARSTILPGGPLKDRPDRH